MAHNTSKIKNIAFYLSMAVFSILILVCEIWRTEIFGEGQLAEDLYLMSTRVIGSILCLILIFFCDMKHLLGIRGTGFGRAVLFTLPCWLIALNNFPIIPYFTGGVYIKADASDILFYALQCLCVGIFEEFAFRGCVFTMVLQNRRKSTKDIFWAIVISSAVFGVVHLMNIFVGASPVSVILQIGYSFLIGGMCSVVLMKTGSLWHCALLHGVYNFCGGVVPRLGGGNIWDAPTVILTVIVSLAVATYVIISFLRITPEDIGYMFNEDKNKLKTE